MKKEMYGFGALLLFVVFVGGARVSHHAQVRSLFCNNGTPTEPLRGVFDHLGVPIATLEQANEFAQKNLIRVGERWDQQTDTEINLKMRMQDNLLRTDLKKLGMMDEIRPAQKKYSYALLMGALRIRFAHRLQYMAALQKQGYEFDTVVLLGGERQLRDEEKEGLPESITTEAQMMQYLYEHHYEKPTEQKVIVVHAPLIQKEDGSFIRPTTDSSLIHFSEIAPQAGSCLVVSNNPYVTRQLRVAQRTLDQSSFPTQGAGREVVEDAEDIVILMDEFARTLYEEYRASKS